MSRLDRGCLGAAFAGLPAVLLALCLMVPVARAFEVPSITAEGQAELLAQPGVELAGSPHPDLTVIEFFDYRCPYCKRFAPVLTGWVREDSRGAIVYKDWPILGDVSRYAARSALAARWQGKYLVAHDALIGAPVLKSDQDVDAALKRAGVDLSALQRALREHGAEIDALLERNAQEARALGLRGTPGVIVGRLVVPGVIGAADLRTLAAEARTGH